MKIEFLMAMASNLREAATVVAVLAGVVVLVSVAVWMISAGDVLDARERLEDEPDSRWRQSAVRCVEAKVAASKRVFRQALLVGIPALLVALIPDPHQMWEARVALLKLELASPENVQRGTEHLDLIVKGLECKYLNQNCQKETK